MRRWAKVQTSKGRGAPVNIALNVMVKAKWNAFYLSEIDCEAGKTRWTSKLIKSTHQSARRKWQTIGAKGLSVWRSGYVNFLGKTKHFGWLSRGNSRNDCIVKIRPRHHRFSVFFIHSFLRIGQLQRPRLEKSLLIRTANRVRAKNALIFGSR